MELLTSAPALTAALFAFPLGVGVVFGLAPQLMIRLITTLFPADDPRRAEMIGEIDEVPFKERVTWCFSEFARGLCEGIPARLAYPPPRMVLGTATQLALWVIVAPVVLVDVWQAGPEASGLGSYSGLAGLSGIIFVGALGAIRRRFVRHSHWRQRRAEV